MQKELFSGCISREFTALGTINSIRIYGHKEQELLRKAQKRVDEIEEKMSAFRPGSEIWELNRSAGKRQVSVSEETFALLSLAKKFNRLSEGAFAVTVRPLVELWSIGKKADFIPNRREIEQAMALVDDRCLLLEEKNRTAFLQNPGQAADLGGIAKGYAADEVKRLLTRAGVKSAMINLGGNIITIGSRPDGQPWRVGIQNPAAVRGRAMGTIPVTGQTVVTSGRNERFFLRDGVCYHHILDPRTGSPAESGLLSVTVVGENSAAADALTTAVFVLGLQKGMALLNSLKAEAVFAADDYRLYLTRGLVHRFAAAQQRQPISAGGSYETKVI